MDPGDKRLRAPDKVEFVKRGGRMVKRVLIGGCWFATLDTEGGIRAYMGPRGAKRFWHGYYSGKATCHFARGSIPNVVSASKQECHLFDDHYDKVCELVGAAPETVIGDKGLSVASVFEKCTRNGTATVVPWRPGGGDLKRHDYDTHDRHGIPRCKHCGGPTGFVRFSVGDRSIRLRTATRACGCAVKSVPRRPARRTRRFPARPTGACSSRCGAPTASTTS